MTELLSESDVISDGSMGNEVEQYLAEPVIDLKIGNPFEWWKQNSSRYPILSELARKYLSAPPTSVGLSQGLDRFMMTKEVVLNQSL